MSVQSPVFPFVIRLLIRTTCPALAESTKQWSLLESVAVNAEQTEIEDSILDEEIPCNLHVTLSVRLLGDLETGYQFIIPVDVKLVTLDEVVVGRMSGDLVLASSIDPESLFDICDSDSAGLAQACAALFPEGSDELHPEINPGHEFVSRFLFIYRSAFLPCVSQDSRQMMLHCLAEKILNHDDVIIGWESLAGLEAHRLAELGYRRIAATGMVFTMLTYTSRFAELMEENETVPSISVVLPATAKDDFEALWQQACKAMPG